MELEGFARGGDATGAHPAERRTLLPLSLSRQTLKSFGPASASTPSATTHRARRDGLDIRKIETNQGKVRAGQFLIVDDEFASSQATQSRF